MSIRMIAAGSAAILAVSAHQAQAQSNTEQLSEVVVTANRTPEPLSATGSAISVVSGQTIATSNPGSLVDALRSVPGIDVMENGGPGGTANVRMRGANTGQTLVMIDGIRVNDPTAASGDFEFAMFAPSAIDRIEVLRGPQSALYGSDAMGGVNNIITKKGGGPAQFDVRTEAGSYGTVTTQGSMVGSNGPWSYAFTAGGQHSNGFSRYGYRITSIEAKNPNLEADGFDRIGGSGRIGYDAGEGIRLEAGTVQSFARAPYDSSSADTASSADRLLQTIYGRVGIDSFGGVLTHNVTVSNTHTERSFSQANYPVYSRPRNATLSVSDSWGDSLGAEYQANLKLGSFGTLVYGAKTQTETAQTFNTNILPIAGLMTPVLSKRQDTNSAFALWSVPIGERLSVTLGSRVDDVVDVARFETWRATAAYNIWETGTKLRASAGTGAKAPTLYQLYDPLYGTRGLSSETSFGYDAGIDQSLFNGRVLLSVTGFSNDFSNLINFITPGAGSPLCGISQTSGCYNNVARAQTSGLEVGANIDIMPGLVKLNAAYTYLEATDLDTGFTLSRRPKNFARFAVSITPNDRWLIEPRITTVSKRYNNANETGQVDAYTRVDLYSEYKLDANWKVFARGENILNERYQEVLNYGTTGPALYAGFNGTW